MGLSRAVAPGFSGGRFVRIRAAGALLLQHPAALSARRRDSVCFCVGLFLKDLNNAAFDRFVALSLGGLGVHSREVSWLPSASLDPLIERYVVFFLVCGISDVDGMWSLCLVFVIPNWFRGVQRLDPVLLVKHRYPHS